MNEVEKWFDEQIREWLFTCGSSMGTPEEISSLRRQLLAVVDEHIGPFGTVDKELLQTLKNSREDTRREPDRREGK